MRNRSAAIDQRRGVAPIRSCARPADQNRSNTTQRAGIDFSPDDASHHQRWLDDCAVLPGIGGVASRLRQWPGLTACGTSNSVRRLCGLAAGMVARRSARAAARLLEESIKRRTAGARVADRSPTAGDADLSRRAHWPDTIERAEPCPDRA